MLSVTVKTPSRIDGCAAGVHHQNGTDLNLVSLNLALSDAKGNVVAVSNRVPLAAGYSTPVLNNGSAFGAVSGVLYSGNSPTTVTSGGSTPFVANPGKYSLRLILTPASSPCPGQSYIGFITLSYRLAGTAP